MSVQHVKLLLDFEKNSAQVNESIFQQVQVGVKESESKNTYNLNTNDIQMIFVSKKFFSE